MMGQFSDEFTAGPLGRILGRIAGEALTAIADEAFRSIERSQTAQEAIGLYTELLDTATAFREAISVPSNPAR